MATLGESNSTTKVRTAEDIERKYNLANMKTDLESIQGQIIETNTELEEFIDVTYPSDKNNLQEQIDGKVETWYYSGIPSLSNLPASNWTTDDEKEKHIGDLYYDKSTGYAYIFKKENNVYSWDDKPDAKTIEALANAAAAQDTADSKRRVFTTQPTPPYDNGDLWLKATPKGTIPETYEYSIMGCQRARTEGQSFDNDDWRIGATDDTYATAITDEMGGTTTTVLSGTVVTIMNNYAKFTDLSTGGSSTINGDNITTGTIKSENYVADTSGTKIKLLDGSIDTKNFKVNSSGEITSTGGTIGGFNISSNSFSKSVNGIYDYDIHDKVLVKGITMNTLPATNSGLDTLDYNESGSITSTDYIYINKILNNEITNEKEVTGTFEINSNNPKKCLAIKDSNDNYLSYMGMGGIGADQISCKALSISNDTDPDNIRVDVNGDTGNIAATGTITANDFVYTGTYQAAKTTTGTDGVSLFKIAINASPPYMEVTPNVGSAYGISMWLSDKRLKSDIKDTNYNALDTINKIKHKSFTYNERNIPIGYIADELEEIDKNLIYEVGKDKIKQPNETYIIPILTKAIQEQQKQIEELKELLRKEK